MSLLRLFKKHQKRNTAKVAKERLQILVAHERSNKNVPDYLPAMQRDIMEVIRKYTQISEEQIQISLDNSSECSILELNVTLPEK